MIPSSNRTCRFPKFLPPFLEEGTVHLDVSDEAEVSLKWEEQEPIFDSDIV